MKRITVQSVRLGMGRVQNVTFTHDRKHHLYVAETPGSPSIKVRFDKADKKFHAFLEGGVLDITDRSGRGAFTKAATRVWYA
jgi:hypothetical protein